MKANQSNQGRISGGFQGVGTATPEMVKQRAREIALINGRTAEDYEDFLDEAKAEVTGARASDEERDEDSAPAIGSLRDIVPGSAGHKIEAKLPRDEQRVPEQLVQEGVDEAEHHLMLAGSTHDTSQNS